MAARDMLGLSHTMKALFRRIFSQGFRDCRSKMVIFVPHCVLNQNARVAGAAESPAAVTELVRGLTDREIGIVQMPCPELQILGLVRGNMDIRRELQKDSNRARCRRLAAPLVEQVEQYRKGGIRVVGLIGKNGSPTCGVEETWVDGITAGTGIFIEELMAELRDRRVAINITGTRDDNSGATLAIIDQWLAGVR
ncbi:MAG: CD3072 family TudS-related putative desulfidase [Candidatus Korobacteraceae bacterium]